MARMVDPVRTTAGAGWAHVEPPPAGLPDGWGHWLLIRRRTIPNQGHNRAGGVPLPLRRTGGHPLQ